MWRAGILVILLVIPIVLATSHINCEGTDLLKTCFDQDTGTLSIQSNALDESTNSYETIWYTVQTAAGIKNSDYPPFVLLKCADVDISMYYPSLYGDATILLSPEDEGTVTVVAIRAKPSYDEVKECFGVNTEIITQESFQTGDYDTITNSANSGLCAEENLHAYRSSDNTVCTAQGTALAWKSCDERMVGDTCCYRGKYLFESVADEEGDWQYSLGCFNGYVLSTNVEPMIIAEVRI